jgi:hypothetical protein
VPVADPAPPDMLQVPELPLTISGEAAAVAIPCSPVASGCPRIAPKLDLRSPGRPVRHKDALTLNGADALKRTVEVTPCLTLQNKGFIVRLGESQSCDSEDDRSLNNRCENSPRCPAILALRPLGSSSDLLRSSLCSHPLGCNRRLINYNFFLIFSSSY